MERGDGRLPVRLRAEILTALYGGNTGIDLLALDPDRPLTQIIDGGGRIGQMGVSNIERFLGVDGKPTPTVGEILDR